MVTDPARPRVLFIGATRYELPLPAGLARKWDAVENELDVRVIARAGAGHGTDPRFRLIGPPLAVLDGAGFYLALPIIVWTEVRRFRPHVVITQSPYEAFASLPLMARKDRPKLVVEIHGDWRTAARLYGSPVRRAIAKLADRAAAFALRRADATRALSNFTAQLAHTATGRAPVASFVTYSDLESFTAEPLKPLPDRPGVAWVGALERTKNPILLADAWRIVAAQVPDARLTIVGRGRLQAVANELVREHPDRVTLFPYLEPPDVARVLDESTVLGLSSESEGFGRVIVEAFARGRPAVACSVSGIPDVVTSGRDGLLVDPCDPEQFAGALVRVLTDRDLAERLADGARESAQRFSSSPAAYARCVRSVVDEVLASDDRG